MEKMKVRELMVPVDKFPGIAAGASFYDALLALERSQKAFLSGESEQRILLVEDEAGTTIGKISPIDLFRGLEKKYDQVDTEKAFKNFGLSYLSKPMQEEHQLWATPFKDLCRKAGEVKIKDFIKLPDEGQSVDVADDLSKGFHLFVMNRHDSLFVYQDSRIVGLLKFSDVYREVSETMKACTLQPSGQG